MRRKDREVTDFSQILAIIEAADSCRLGMVDTSGPQPEPYIAALNFAFEPAADGSTGGSFWFHCARQGRKLDILAKNSRVCIQLDIDHVPVPGNLACDWGMKYASIFATGTAVLVEDPAGRQHGLDLLMAHYARLWPQGDPGLQGKDAAPASPGQPGKPADHPAHPVTSGEGFVYDPRYLAMTAMIRVDTDSLSAKRKV